MSPEGCPDQGLADTRISLAEPLLTAEDAGVLLGGIPPKTVLQLAREARLPSVRIGKHVRFVRAELEEALMNRRI